MKDYSLEKKIVFMFLHYWPATQFESISHTVMFDSLQPHGL